MRCLPPFRTLACSALLLAAATARAASPASVALAEGRLDQAIALLQAGPHDAASQLLLCRAQYAYGHIDAALQACQAAIADGLAKDSDAQDWLGRVLGAKTEHVNFIHQASMAGKVRDAFEAAVAANPRNAAAIDDLSEYYVNAPGFMGGGTDRALALATRVEAALPQSAHRIRAMVADKHNDPVTAEREYRAVIAVRPSAAGPYCDLARFLFKHKQSAAATAALHKGADADTTADPALADIASIFFDEKLELPFAADCARKYLASPARSDAVPAPRVHVLLARIAVLNNDKPTAKSEVAAALALAATFDTARKLQGTL